MEDVSGSENFTWARRSEYVRVQQRLVLITYDIFQT